MDLHRGERHAILESAKTAMIPATISARNGKIGNDYITWPVSSSLSPDAVEGQGEAGNNFGKKMARSATVSATCLWTWHGISTLFARHMEQLSRATICGMSRFCTVASEIAWICMA